MGIYSTLALHHGLNFVGIHKWLYLGGSLRHFDLSSRKELEQDVVFQVKQRLPMFECGGRVFIEPNASIPERLVDEPYTAGVQWVTLSKAFVALSIQAFEQNRLFESAKSIVPSLGSHVL